MGKKFQRCLALCCAILLIFSFGSAQADFSPYLSTLSPEKGFTLSLSATLESMENGTDSTLALLKDALPRLKILLSGQEASQRTQTLAQIAWDDAPLLSIFTQAQPDFTLTSFSSSGQSYLTAPSQPDALALLAGEKTSFPLIANLPQLYTQWAPALYPLLSEYAAPKKSKTTTSIKNATASSAYENYTLDADTMNAAWPRILNTLLPLLQDALQDQPAWYQEAEKLLSSLVFSGSCRFKRFLDKQDGDMGLQFTGNAALGGDVRKVTLFGGYTPDKGGFVSLALPAVKGKNNFKISFTGKITSKETKKETQKTLTLEGSYTRTMDGEKESAALTGSCKNIIQQENGSEAWSGKFTVDTNLNGEKNTWTLTPALSATDTGLSGTVDVRKKEGNTQVLKGQVILALTPEAQMPLPSAASALDLRLMTSQQARANLMGEMKSLSRLLLDWLDTLPKETRALLTHDLRTDSWMNGEWAPLPSETAAPHAPNPLDENYESPWIVEEEW
ncbi:MAG: hypothetical protein E7329_05495 [Clostridiales bacterium]|nr:hypothetical protein [Clostridiales bacterium]